MRQYPALEAAIRSSLWEGWEGARQLADRLQFWTPSSVRAVLNCLVARGELEIETRALHGSVVVNLYRVRPIEAAQAA